MIVPFSVVVINPLPVGRGDGPNILNDLLTNLPISLRLFREFAICHMTWTAILPPDTTLRAIEMQTRPAWCCLFTHVNRTDDPTPLIEEYCGPEDRLLWNPSQLRMKYSGYKVVTNPLHLSSSIRADFTALCLFRNFKAEDI